MSRTVISVKGLSKRYRLGLKEKKADTLMGSIADIIRSPFANYKRIRSLSRMDKEDESIFWALKDIDFDVKEGEVLGIIGHNGAGKSTLLKILSSITEPTAGQAVIYGRVSSLLEVGTGFHQELTGRENVYMNGTILGMTKKEIDRKFDEIIDFSGVEKHLDTAVKFYSSGMKVRLGFSVAAFLEPDILIIDEVLAVGDADFQRKCLGKMEDVATRGRTVLFVSHNMLAVKSLCKTGLLLKSGNVACRGTSEEVVNYYLQEHAPKAEVKFRETDVGTATEMIAIKSIAVNTSEGDGRFSITEPFIIEILFLNKKNENNFNVNLFFNTPDGTNIFVTASRMERIPSGEFRAICKVPGDFLNDGYYNLDVMVVENAAKPVFSIKNVITIQGIEPPRESTWMGKYPGLVRPNFDWTLNEM